MSAKTKIKVVVGAGGDASSLDGGADPMADMMKKILGQEVASASSSVPVLAKRKTDNMKEIELERGDRKKQKLIKQQKKMNEEKQLVIPDIATVNFEKSLKKIATRGVVSLFNAIAKAKRTDLEENGGDAGEGDGKKSKSKSKVDVQALSRDNFVKLLQKSSTDKDSNNNSNSNINSSVSGATKTSKVSSDAITSSITNSIKNGIKASQSGSSSTSKANWSVVQDKDTLFGAKSGNKNTKKGWDEEDDSEEGGSGSEEEDKTRSIRFNGGKMDGEDDDLFKEVSDDEGALKMTSVRDSDTKSKSKKHNSSNSNSGGGGVGKNNNSKNSSSISSSSKRK